MVGICGVWPVCQRNLFPNGYIFQKYLSMQLVWGPLLMFHLPGWLRNPRYELETMRESPTENSRPHNSNIHFSNNRSMSIHCCT